MSETDYTPLQDVIVAGELTCNLEEAALHIARQAKPHLDFGPYLRQLDEYAELVRPMLSEEPDAAETIGALNDVLFHNLGFHGNNDDYYAPENSFLNEVIERRTGIPISLSVLYMAVATRLGLEVLGTAFPGHFLLRVDRPGWPIVVDAFDSGRILAEEDCEARAQQMDLKWKREMLTAVTPQYIVRRMLNNLKMIYFNRRDWRQLHQTTRQILVVTPEDHDEHFTLGVALAGLNRLQDSLQELTRFLELRPEASNRLEVLQMIQELRGRISTRES